MIPRNFPNLFRRPERVVGIPVAFAILRLTFVMPSARFQLKDRPGILNPFFDMLSTNSQDAFVTWS